MNPDEVTLRRCVGKQIRVARVLHDLSQDEVAQAAGVTRNFVSAIERGAQGLDAYRLGLIAQALDLELAELLTPTDLLKRTKETV